METFLLVTSPHILYPAIFIGILFIGGGMLVPALYGTLTGHVNLLFLFVLTVGAAGVSDTVWFFLGWKATKDRLYRFPIIRKRVEEARHFSSFFIEHGVLLVFLTKFIWGTRIASHVLAGMHKLNLFKFLASTAFGTAIWFWLLYAITRLMDNGVGGTKATATHIQLVFFGMFLFLILVNLTTGKFVRKKLYRSSK